MDEFNENCVFGKVGQMSLFVVGDQVELVSWTKPELRKGRIAPIDCHGGIVSICNARVKESKYSEQLVLPNSGHFSHKIKEGTTKSHKS
jgi:hypothetical protein